MPEVAEVCRRFARTALPAAEPASTEQAGALAGCDADAAFYGLGTTVDFARARLCALAARRAPGAPETADSGILMMLYARGLGVGVDYDLALRFACEMGNTPEDVAALVERLWQARLGSRPVEALDQCDLISNAYCQLLAERVAGQARQARMQTATLGMPASELAALRRAATQFIDSRTSKELEQSGPMSARQVLEERSHLEDQLVEALERLHDASPPLNDSSAPKSGAELASLLARIATCKLLAESEHQAPGAVSRAGVQATQASWLGYRRAFVTLATRLHPTSPAETWQSWFAGARLEQLRELASGC